MNLHEYQAKELLAQYNIPAPKGQIAANAEEAVAAAKQMGGDAWVVKAQVHAGGRGKAGGVKFVRSLDDVMKISQNLIGKNLVTYQTDAKGQPVNLVLISEPTDIDRELYLGAVVDRAYQRIVFMASTEGGVDIEEVANSHPEKIHHIVVDPLVGVMPHQARELGFKLDLTSEQLKQFTHIMTQLGKMFVECDLGMLEINPLVVRTDAKLTCLDAKIVVDANAMYRQPHLRAMRDPSQEDERENRALNWELNYIALDGDIGCMVNGAGLAMATMDLIKLHGGNPANFLDVGGGATKERVTEAFKIILSDPNVKGILVNIFGGIVRCDMIAEGILSAVAEVGVNLPVVVRLEGNNAGLAATILNESGMNIIAAKGFDDAARQIVKAVKGE
ncbi:MAG: ADP-forming succinate--CoA ligase subunit beta [Legionellales bacterium]|nr:ADP-forming succinate--CoA ligase subunit beta [Legionellales bacterium]